MVGVGGAMVTFTLLFWVGFMWDGGEYIGEDVPEMWTMWLEGTLRCS